MIDFNHLYSVYSCTVITKEAIVPKYNKVEFLLPNSKKIIFI